MTRLPFAMIDEITDDSPAAVDGLQLGDEIVKFGSVEAGDRLQGRLVSEALSNEDSQVSLVIIRQGSPMNLTVTPRKWHGRGLLGYVLLNLCMNCSITLLVNKNVQIGLFKNFMDVNLLVAFDWIAFCVTTDPSVTCIHMF